MEVFKMKYCVVLMMGFLGFSHCIEMDCRPTVRNLNTIIVCNDLSVKQGIQNEEFTLSEEVKKAFKNITKIAIMNSKLDFIPKAFIKAQPKIEQISITDSNFTSMDDSFFKDFKQIKTLELSMINFDQVQENVFEPLTELTNLNIKDCKINNLTSLIFEKNTKLTNIDLAENPIKSIHPELFKNVPSEAKIIFQGACLSETVKASNIENDITNKCEKGNIAYLFKPVTASIRNIKNLQKETAEMKKAATDLEKKIENAEKKLKEEQTKTNKKIEDAEKKFKEEQDKTNKKLNDVTSSQKTTIYVLVATNVVSIVGFVAVILIGKK